MTVAAYIPLPTQAQDVPGNFATRFAEMTEHSGHEYETAVHKLLNSLARYREDGVLTNSEYEATIGSATKVMSEFRLDLNTLAACDAWYRASVIHQMGQGILHAIHNNHEHLTLDAEYQDALKELGIGEDCRRWTAIQKRMAGIAR